MVVIVHSVDMLRLVVDWAQVIVAARPLRAVVVLVAVQTIVAVEAEPEQLGKEMPVVLE
jgi:hypothetical protein